MSALTIPILFLVFVLCCWLLFKKHEDQRRFWRQLGVPLLDPIPFFGQKEFSSIFNKSYFEIIHSLYQNARSRGLKYCTVFQFSEPSLMVLDPQLIGRILAKDASHFADRFDRSLDFSDHHPMSQRLFSVSGLAWKDISKFVSPVVSPGRINFLIEEMERGFQQIHHLIDSKTFDIVNADLFAFQLNEDLVGQATLGVPLHDRSGSLSKVTRTIKSFFDASVANWFKFYIPLVFPWFSFLSVPKISDGALGNFIKEIMPLRRINETGRRNDVFQFFVSSKNKRGARRELFDEFDSPQADCTQKDDSENLEVLVNNPENRDISRRIFWFLVDGLGTNAAALTFVLHLISLHPECQEKVRQEVGQTLRDRGESQMTYQVVKDLRYTHKVVKECLRFYTPMSMLQRVCTKKYNIPDSSVFIPEGTKIIIPIYSIHRDPQFFPDPLIFNPSRFDDLSKIIPYTFMPFGEGPRFCIGFRFGMAYLKFVVAKLVSKIVIQPLSTDKDVLVLHPFSPEVLKSREDILIKYVKHSDC